MRYYHIDKIIENQEDESDKDEFKAEQLVNTE